MHRHCVSTEELLKDRMILDRAGSRHFFNVLRLRSGDAVTLFDGKGSSALFQIAKEATSSSAVLERVGEVQLQSPPLCHLILAACISKGSRMDWTIEKAVELGVSEVVPILSRNSVVRISDPADAEDKRCRWERVATDAARQCGSDFIPKIALPQSFDKALARLSEISRIYAGALTDDAVLLRDALARDRNKARPESVTWMVGPEGDFSPDELEALRSANANLVSLGKLVLRTETAAVYGLCVFGSEWL